MDTGISKRSDRAGRMLHLSDHSCRGVVQKQVFHDVRAGIRYKKKNTSRNISMPCHRAQTFFLPSIAAQTILHNDRPSS